MVKMQNIFLFLIAISIFACNSNSGNSAYDELLSHPPYASLTDSIHDFPKNDDLYYRRGLLLYKNDNLPPALDDVKKAWSLNKKEEYAAAISTILKNSGKTDSAILFLTEAVKVLPASVRLKLNLAEAYEDKQKINDALQTINSILSQQPKQLDALILKSDLLDLMNDSAASLATLEQAYSIAPSDEDVCYNLASKYAERKDPKVLAICDSLEKADSLHEKGDALYFKGLYYSNLGDMAKALSFFDQTIQRDYNYKNAYIEKGKLLYDQKKINEALKVFSLAATVRPDFADSYFWMGKCEEALGQKDEARLNYQRAYALDKTFTEAKDAFEKLGN